MNRPAISPRHVRATLSTLGILTGVLLAGCSTQSPLETTVQYQSADGVAARSGVVEARDLLLISSKKDAAGLLSGSLINTSTEPVTVTFLTRADSEAGGTAGPATTVQLKAREQKRLETVQLASVPAAPGALTGIVMQTSAGQTLVNVPVLPPVGPYASLTPRPTATG